MVSDKSIFLLCVWIHLKCMSCNFLQSDADANGNYLEAGILDQDNILKPSINPKSNSTDDELTNSDYTDPASAPTELLAEFLSAVMLRDYLKAYQHCKKSEKRHEGGLEMIINLCKFYLQFWSTNRIINQPGISSRSSSRN